MLYNKKYNIVRSGSVYEKSNNDSDGSIAGKYKSLCISPIPHPTVNSLKISATDSHRKPSYTATLPISTAIGRIPYRPFYLNSKFKGKCNPSPYSRGIHVIPQDLFESLPESKVDPDVVSNTRKVCLTYCSNEATVLTDSHAVNLEVNNRLSTSGQEVCSCLQLKSQFNKKVFQNEDNQKSSVFTLVGRQIVNPDKNQVNDDSLKQKPISHSQATIFSVLGSPKIQNYHEKSLSLENRDETNNLNKNSELTISETANDNSESISNNDSQYKNVKVCVNEKLNFRLSVPQELPIQSIKEFCRGMSQDKEGNQTEKLESVTQSESQVSQVSSTKVCITGSTLKIDRKNHLTSLKSPTIVKEVMKKIASIPSGGFEQNDDIRVTETESVNTSAETDDINDCYETQKFNNANDTEAMLVIQELDRSIAEGSPSNANSPVIYPRIYQKKIINNKLQLINIGIKPSKPPRLLSSGNTMALKRKQIMHAIDTQTDNLIEEVYLAGESGSKSNEIMNDNEKGEINASVSKKSIESVSPIESSTMKERESVLSFNNRDNYIHNYKNGNNFNLNYTIKPDFNGTKDLECAIARASLSSIDSGTSSPHPPHLIVVAIDFGTTFSGYSFSFIRDPDNIHMMRKVEGCDPDVSNQKIPTILLLDPDGAFHSFGFAARDHYSSLEPKEAKRWFYFEKFKMNLHYDEHLSFETKIKAANGSKSFDAITVFEHSLRYFKKLAIQEFSDQTGTKMFNEDIRWVITVPAIWKPSAKQFMREAAYRAGIGNHDNPYQLLIALEPEAASIYCRKLKMSQLVPMTPSRRHSLITEKTNEIEEAMAVTCDKGTKYIVVDVGGGTVDITCHQIETNQGCLKELHKAMGGPIGSIGVDKCFENLLSDIFGAEFMTQFKIKRPSGYVDLMSAFEARKRSSSPQQCTTSNISLPFSFINFFKKNRGMTVENAVKKHSGVKGISYCSKIGMLRLEPHLMQQLFEPVTKQIINHITDVLNNKLVKDVNYLFLVGGFAESQILQSHIRNAFTSRLKVIIPQSPNLAILRGATIYGLDPTVISCRRARLTYGVGVLNKFIRGKHPLHKLAIKDNIEWCADVFDKFVSTDQSLGLFETITRSYTPVNESQTCSIIHIYSSENDAVQFITDEGAKRCGTLYLDLDVIKQSDHINPAFKYLIKREIQTQMIFGDTEIKVTALDVATGKCVKAEIDFLNN